MGFLILKWGNQNYIYEKAYSNIYEHMSTKQKTLQIKINYATWKNLTIKKLRMDAKNWRDFLEKIARDTNE